MEAITPQVVFYIFGLPITNTVVSTWVMMVLIIVIVFLICRFKPTAAEMMIDTINNIVSSVMPENTNVTKYIIIL